MDFRSRLPRHVAGWTGSCHIGGEPVGEHRECRVLALSEHGLAVLLQHPHGTLLIGRRISVESPTTGASVSVQLEGDVRNVRPVDDNAVRLGIEFVGLSGQSFQVHGMDGAVYALISDENMQLNARFAFLEGRDRVR